MENFVTYNVSTTQNFSLSLTRGAYSYKFSKSRLWGFYVVCINCGPQLRKINECFLFSAALAVLQAKHQIIDWCSSSWRFGNMCSTFVNAVIQIIHCIEGSATFVTSLNAVIKIDHCMKAFTWKKYWKARYALVLKPEEIVPEIPLIVYAFILNHTVTNELEQHFTTTTTFPNL